MKNKIVLLFLIFLVSFGFASEVFDSDISIFQSISQSFENKYYPDTIEKVELLEKNYPSSVFMQRALVLKSKAQIKLGYYEDSIGTLKKAINQMYTGKTEYTLCNYLLGKSYWYLKDYENAIKSFYRACTLSKVSDEKEYYDSSVYYAADSYFKMEKYKDCISLYEYVVENGNCYSVELYETAIKNLLFSYKKTQNDEKITVLYKSLEPSLSLSIFTSSLVKDIYIYAGEAFENIEQYDSAFDVYTKLISLKDNNLSLYALNRIYTLCVNDKINRDIKSILQEIEKATNEEDKYILDDFYVRLGINEYENKNYEKSYEYFSLLKNENIVSDLYIAKMILDTDSSVDGSIKAKKRIEKYSDKDLKNKDIKNLSDTYYAILLQCAMQTGDMKSIPSIYSKIKNPSSKENFINSYYYYENHMYDKVQKDTGILYASALCHLGKYGEGVAEYKKIEETEKLNDNALMEYGKALFILKDYENAYNTVSKSNCLEKQYVMGLCQISLKNYEKALEHFITYIKNTSNEDVFYPLAFYYKGFIEYSLRQYKNANASFVRFLNETKNDTKKYEKYINSSYTYATVAALETNDNDNAVFYAGKVLEKANEKAKTYEERINAVRFYFKVLTDTKNYDMAISLLEPYSKNGGDFAPEALFYIAKTYEEKGDIENALKNYNYVRLRFSKTKYAEEAFYRCGEIYYINEDYFMAYKEFNDYVYKYPSGAFIDSALFFSGDAAFRLGEVNKAIMINKSMVTKYPDSRYAYSASINLLRSYYEKEEYENALEVAINIVEKFGEQAHLDNVDVKVTELERIVSGTSRNIAQKMSEYEIKGKNETKEGRKAGSELVTLYTSDPYKSTEAFTLAKEILDKQLSEEKKNNDNSESEYMAANAEVIGDYYRSQNNNKEAADYYLLSAKYYRQCGNSLRAASTLYGATEAFTSGSLMGDAKQTASLLKKLYPNSKYAEKVDDIIR